MHTKIKGMEKGNEYLTKAVKKVIHLRIGVQFVTL